MFGLIGAEQLDELLRGLGLGSQIDEPQARLFGKDPLESRNIVVLSVLARLGEESLLDGVVALLMPRDGIGRSRVLSKESRP